MASKFYPKGVMHLIKGDVTGGLDAADCKAALVTIDTGVTDYYTYDATDEVIGDVNAAAIKATSGVMTTPAVSESGGVIKFTADGVTWASVAAGDDVGAVVVYWESGSAGTRYLIAYDEFTPETPDGNNIVLTWGADGIAKITT